MPTHFRGDEAPIVHFDLALEVSPFFLFRRLKEAREAGVEGPLLVDVRAAGAAGDLTLAGAEPWGGEAWEPPRGREVVLFDDDGSRAVDLARDYQARGFPAVRALFGGLGLYEFSLDPEVVGAETFLLRG